MFQAGQIIKKSFIVHYKQETYFIYNKVIQNRKTENRNGKKRIGIHIKHIYNK